MNRLIVLGSAIVLSIAMTIAHAQSGPQPVVPLPYPGPCCEFWCPKPLPPECDHRPSTKRPRATASKPKPQIKKDNQ
jgi:hypothetical protein